MDARMGWARARVALAAAVMITTGAAAQDQVSSRQTVQTPQVVLPPFTSVEELLEAVEDADRDTRTLRGRIQHITINTLANDTQRRDGELFLRTDRSKEVDGVPERQFAIRFDSLIVDGRRHEDRRWFVFDGEWIAEIDIGDRQFNKWQVVPPGERLDPFDDPSNSPFWLPLGREKDRIEKVAETEMLGPADWFEGEEMPDGLERFAREMMTVQLRMVPREGTKFSEKWEEVRIWFDQRTMLPTIYVAVDKSGDMRIAMLHGVEVNSDLGDDTFTTEEPLEAGWDVTIEPYRESAEQ